jgi:hypothetical protein
VLSTAGIDGPAVERVSMIFVKLMFLPMMLKILERCPRPLTLAIFYSLGLLTNGLIFDMAFGGNWLHSVILPFAQALLEAWAYFYLLTQTEGTGSYWGVLVVGGILLLIF